MLKCDLIHIDTIAKCTRIKFVVKIAATSSTMRAYWIAAIAVAGNYIKRSNSSLKISCFFFFFQYNVIYNLSLITNNLNEKQQHHQNIHISNKRPSSHPLTMALLPNCYITNRNFQGNIIK